MNTDSTIDPKDAMKTFVEKLPKVELHLHLEGTLEPELILSLAARNKLKLAYTTIDEIRDAYQFKDLQSFLDILNISASVLQKEEDYYDLTIAYLKQCKLQNIHHIEMQFGAQKPLRSGVALEAIMGGIHAALKTAAHEWGISSALILSFERSHDEASAINILQQATRIGDLTGVGLASAEVGNPPHKFRNVFQLAKSMGLRRVAHAGEEGPPEYISGALDVLDVERIDHGVRCIEDMDLVRRLRDARIPLTVCPFSNVALKVFPDLRTHNIGRLLDLGLFITINSDDPAYFGGNLNDNIIETLFAFERDIHAAILLQRNAIEASFCDQTRKTALHTLLDHYIMQNVSRS